MTSPAVVPSSAEGLRKGWCPGALRPMRTGDGLLVRLRIAGGIAPAGLARDIAGCARQFGNGLVDLSARANLQLRGVTDETVGPLTTRLEEFGLLDEDPAAEAVRNVMASPLAGADPAALLDIRPVVRALETRLSNDKLLHGLPGKFGFLVDDGGACGLGNVPADIRFEAYLAHDGPRFAVQAGGSALSAQPVATCRPDDVASVAATLAMVFLAERGEGAGADRRMATLAEALGGRRLAELAGLAWADPTRGPVPAGPGPVLGAWTSGELPVFGIGAAFGSWTADSLAAVADLADRHGTGEIRLTPWRAVLLPGARLDREAVAALDPGLIVDPADPRRLVAACTGAPGCQAASVPARTDAIALVEAVQSLRAVPGNKGREIVLHVSGCPKGCAHPGAAPVVLVGRDGLYDIVRNGCASDPPLRTGLTAAAAGAALATGDTPIRHETRGRQ